MSEEEKKAIEELDFELTESYVHDIGIYKQTLQDFKNLIEKQAKEIINLKEDFNKANNIAIRNMTEYIPKQNIREKIDYFKGMGKDSYDYYYYEDEIEALESLLEEE